MSILVEEAEARNIITGESTTDFSPAWQFWLQCWNAGFNLVPSDGKVSVWHWDFWQDTRQSNKDFWKIYVAHQRAKSIAIVTGSRGDAFPGVVVVDGDDATAIEVIHERCPTTPLTVQGRRADSRHYYYRHPGGIYIQQELGVTLDSVKYKLDVKADGNYVIAPGSEGKTWSQPFTTDLIESLPVYDPVWLPNEKGGKKARTTNASSPGCSYSAVNDRDHVGLIAREDLIPMGQRIEKARNYCRAVPGAVAGDGTGEATLLKLAYTLAWGFLLSEEAVYELLYEWGNREDQKYEDGSHFPWSDKEISHKLSDAVQGSYRGSPGDKIDPELQVNDYRDKLSDSLQDMLDRRDAKKTEQDPEPAPEPEQHEDTDVEPEELEEPDTGMEDRPRKKNSMLEESTRLEALTPLQAWAIALKRPREPFIENHSTFGDITMLFGVAGGGKSELVKKIIMSSIFRKDFFGCRIKDAHHLYIDPENGQNTLVDLYNQCGTDPADIMEMPDPFSEDWDTVSAKSAEFYDRIANHACKDEKLMALEKYLTIVSDRPDNFGPEVLGKLLEDRRSTIGNGRLAVYMDPFRALHSHIEGYDENSVNCIQPLLDDYNRIAKEFNVSLWILHHTLKSNNGKGVGSGAFYGAASNILIYERSPEEFASPGILKVYRMRGQSPGAPIRIGMDTKNRTMFRLPSDKEEKLDSDDILARQQMNMIESFLKYDEDSNQSQIIVKARLKSIPKNRVPVVLDMLVKGVRPVNRIYSPVGSALMMERLEVPSWRCLHGKDSAWGGGLGGPDRPVA